MSSALGPSQDYTEDDGAYNGDYSGDNVGPTLQRPNGITEGDEINIEDGNIIPYQYCTPLF